MCDACEYPLLSTPTSEPTELVVGRRALLRRAGIGGAAAAAAALVLPDGIAGALGPPFESVQLGEDHLAAVAPVVSAAVPAATPSAQRRQSSGRVSAPAIVSRAEWGADESIRTAERGFAPIRKFVVHHTASANKPRKPVQVVRDMYHYHVKGRGFSDVGYNFAIDHRGTIYEGRWARSYGSGETPDGEDGSGYGVVGAHSLGVNAGSCGVVLIGDFTKAQPTNAAIGALIHLLSWKASMHQIDALGEEEYISIFGVHRQFPNIAGHRQTGETVCPGRGLYNQLGWIRQEVAARAGRYPDNTINMGQALRWTEGVSPLAASGSSSGGTVIAGPNPANPTGAKLTGYRLLTSDGKVVTLGKAAKLGSPRDQGMAAATAISGVPGRNAYLTADQSGRVVSFGGAASGAPNQSVGAADMATTPSGQGYWVLTAGGGVYAFGSAKHHGSLMRAGVGSGGVKLRSTPSGKGYWILAGNGRIYAFGDARKLGSPSSGPAVDFWPTPTGNGYWVLLADGRVGAHGDAGYFGDVPGLSLRWAKPAVSIIGMPSGRGYAIVSSDGGVFNFGSSPFLGSLGGSGRHVVGMALAFG